MTLRKEWSTHFISWLVSRANNLLIKGIIPQQRRRILSQKIKTSFRSVASFCGEHHPLSFARWVPIDDPYWQMSRPIKSGSCSSSIRSPLNAVSTRRLLLEDEDWLKTSPHHDHVLDWLERRRWDILLSGCRGYWTLNITSSTPLLVQVITLWIMLTRRNTFSWIKNRLISGELDQELNLRPPSY